MSSKPLLRTYYVLGADPDTKGTQQWTLEVDIPRSWSSPPRPHPPATDSRKVHALCCQRCQVLQESEKTKQPKWTKETKTHFSKEDTQMANKCIGQWGCTASLVIIEMQIKIATRHPFSPYRMVVIKKQNNKCWCANREIGVLLVGMQNDFGVSGADIV